MAKALIAQADTVTLTGGPAELSGWSQALRAKVLAEATSYSERPLLLAESFKATEGEPWREIRCAKAEAHLLDHLPIQIREGERLVGWHPNCHPDEARRQAIADAQTYLRSQAYYVPASEGHMGLDYPNLLARGLDSYLAEIRERRANLELLAPDRPAQEVFYNAAEISLTACIALIDRYADEARRMAETADDPAWAAELSTIADCCARIAHQPAETFRDALQLMWFLFLSAALSNGESHHCFGPGRIDQYLLPYLEADRAAGRCDEVVVDDLLDQLFIKCNEFAPRQMSAVILVVGGRKPDGSDATNELSHRLLYTSCRTRMYFPGVDISWHRDMPAAFVADACTLLRNGNGQPSFFNDQVIIDGLMRHGVPYEHAIDHLPSTCTETSIMGRTNPWVAWPYVNLAHALLAALQRDVGDMDELTAALDDELKLAAHEAVRRGIMDQARAARSRPFPLLSCFVQGCLETGRNISDGGALYNFLQPEAVGVSNVVDGLAAIRTLVFEQGRYTLDELRDALAADWEGHEPLHRAVLRECPKYGNDEGWVNDLFTWVATRWCDHIEGAKNHFGGPVFPGFLGWTVWIGFGKNTTATPDGRRAGQPLANSLAPCSGVKVKGIPSMMLSASGLDHSRGLGGITYNVRFNGASLREPGGPARLQAIVETALGHLGLYMLQFEIASSETLRAAQQQPADYQDLFVRIGGYLVPFTLLDHAAQTEVIERAELSL